LAGRDTWAVWWLELGPRDGGWVIESHVAIDPDVFHEELVPRYTKSAGMVAAELSDVVARLKNSLDNNQDFANAL
jgi:hypothetical protein